jgi:hypothetical protein
MSLYKYGISDKTIGAMQNSDLEVQQMLENAQQNNETQPPASNGIMDIIKELFGFGNAQSSDLGQIANLQSILNPKTPRLGLEPLYPNFGAPMLMEEPYPPQYGADFVDNDLPYLKELTPTTNMGATGTVPTLKEGILSQVDSRFPLYDDFTVAEEGDDLEDNAVTVDELGNLKQPSGFKDFLKTMLGFAIPGAGLFTGDRSALEGIKSLNQRLRQSDFAQSKTLADYFDARRYGGRDERDAAAARTMAQARGITKSLASRPSSDSGGYQKGPGGSGAQTTSAKTKTSSPTNVGNPFGYR